MTGLPKAVEEAKAQGAVLELIGEDDSTYYFKEPGKPDMNRYLASAAKGKLAAAVQNLVCDLAIHPDQGELQQMFKTKPGRMVAISNALQNQVGLNEEFAVKKL